MEMEEFFPRISVLLADRATRLSAVYGLATCWTGGVSPTKSTPRPTRSDNSERRSRCWR